MSRTYTLQMLLEHGGLTHGQIVEITGWSKKAVHKTLWQLSVWKSIKKTGKRRLYVYELA